MIYEIERDDPAKPLIIKQAGEESLADNIQQIVKELFQLQFLTNERRMFWLYPGAEMAYEVTHRNGKFAGFALVDPEELKT